MILATEGIGMRIRQLIVSFFVFCFGCSSSNIQAGGSGKQGRSPGNGIGAVPLTWLDNSAEQVDQGDYGRQLNIGGRERYYEFHIPPGYRADKPIAVVLVLHGGGGNAALARFQSGMDAVANKETFVAVFPAGTSPNFTDRRLFWNTGRPMKDPSQAADDVGYIATVIEDLAKYASIDRQRVYVCGISNGAQMCFRLAVDLPIAAVGTVAGHMLPDELPGPPKRSLPIIDFHGKQDRFAPIGGGGGTEGNASPFEEYRLAPQRQMITSWVKQNGITGAPEEVNPGRGANRLHYRGGENKADIVVWTLDDAGHTWPGGQASPFETRQLRVGPVSTAVNASQAMWDFFKDHPYPKEVKSFR